MSRRATTARPFGIAQRNTPQLYTGYFTYSAGIPFLRAADMAGGGKVPVMMPRGTFTPLVATYTTPRTSLTGGGSAVADPLRLTSLLNPAGNRSGLG